jgi:single-strand DNA-binding protein
MSNHITIHGNVGQEPEVRITPSNMTVVTFTVADTYGKDANKKTTWHNITAFGQLAENISNSLHKGDTVIVSGRLEDDEFTKKDGTKGKSRKVIADEVGVSLRWNVYLKDNTEQTMKNVQKAFGKPVGFDDF